MVLLFIDMLGVRARWHDGGRESVEEAFAAFRSVITEAIRTRQGGIVSHGAIESDSAAIICPSLRVAINIGRNAFRIAFLSPKSPTEERLWLRGVIVPITGDAPLRTERPLAQDLEQIKVSEYSSSLLEAISAEKAGFKGMRLLVGGGISYKAAHGADRIMIHGEPVRTFIRLRTPPYPGRLKVGYRDILWMASQVKEEREELENAMFYRLKWAAPNGDELIHAAITQVAFNHCKSFYESLKPKEDEDSLPAGNA